MTSREHPTPHDALFKAVFADGESAFALVRPTLPPELVRALDSASLRLEPASFVDEDLREVHRDLLFSAKLEKRDVLLYVLVEHQRRTDPLMPLRMLRYVVRVWEAWLRKHPRARRIPAVIPIVVHQGPAAWKGPTRLAELIELPPSLLASAARHLPALELTLQDLGRSTTEALAALPGPPVARLALILLHSAAGAADFGATLERWAPLVHELLQDRRGVESLRTLLRYTFLVSRLDLGAFAEKVRQSVGREAGDVAKTMYEQAIEIGHREILTRLLRSRFGDLDEATATRIERASKTELERWADRVLVAKTLQGVFTSPRKPRPGRGKA